MPRPAKSNTKPARKPEPPAHPVDPAAFATLVRTLRTAKQREAVYEQMCREFRRHSALYMTSSPTPGDPAQRQLFEERALELTREPQFHPTFPDSLEFAIQSAWRDLISLRSRRFAERLIEWTDSPDEALALEAMQHLVYLGRLEDLPTLTAIIARGDRRQILALVDGCELAVINSRTQPGFSDVLQELLTRFVLGTSACPGAPSDEIPSDEVIFSIISLLLLRNRRAAIRLLASNKVLRPDNPAMLTAVRWLALLASWDTDVQTVRRAIKPGAIRPVYQAVSSRPATDRWRSSHLTDALTLGALTDPAFFAAEIQALRARTSEDPELRRAIATVTRTLRATPTAAILVNRFPSLRKRLQPPAAQVLAAGYFVLQVMGDGLAATLRTHGNLWPAAARGLELIGKRSASTALTKAATLAFGPQAASITSRQAMKQMSALIEQLPPQLDKACTRFEDLSETVFPAMERYIDRQPAPFRL